MISGLTLFVSLLSRIIIVNCLFPSVGEDVEKREHLYTAGGNINLCGHYGKLWRFSKKLKIELPYDPAIPFLGIHPKKTKTLSQKDKCTLMFTIVLFTIAM